MSTLVPPPASPGVPRVSYQGQLEHVVQDLLDKIQREKPTDAVDFLQKTLSQTFTSPPASPVTRFPSELGCRALSIVVLGASGDLAKKKTFPALFQLFDRGFLPPTTSIVGYARSALTKEQLCDKIRPALPKKDVEPARVDAFLRTIDMVTGAYDSVESFAVLHQRLLALERAKCPSGGSNRVFYLALPPTAFVDACRGIKAACTVPATDGWARIVVEKPFGHDTDSSLQLTKQLTALFREDQLFRIDHYLGKEMVKNIVCLRFANHVFSSVWNRNHIHSVQITFKEQIGTEGRGGYFDSFGIIRDVIQNHLTQIFALVAMERPRSLSGEDIRDEKVALLKCVLPADPANCVLGQYTAKPDGSVPGYLDDPTVPRGSTTPTFASLVLYVQNDRWDGVPFIIKAGKAMESKQVTVRIQFRNEIRPFVDEAVRNELVIRAQPDEAVYMKINVKAPGMLSHLEQTELDLSYRTRYSTVSLPEAYESLINEVIVGNSTNFVRDDELDAAWKIFTPLLHAIDAGRVAPKPYPMGSRGPPEADAMVQRLGYVRSSTYKWNASI